jgi:hypothetical protein
LRADACEKCGEVLVGKESYCTKCGAETRLSPGRGFRFGALVGFIEATILTIYGYLTSAAYLAVNEMIQDIATTGYPEHIRLAYLSFTKFSYYSLLLVSPIFAIGIGGVLGLVFVRVQRRMPFRTVSRKALLFAFVVSLTIHTPYLWFFVSYRTVFMAFLQLIVTNCIMSFILDLVVCGLFFSYLLTNR